MKLVSKAFANGGAIPDKYSCEGENKSPPLEIADVPNKAQSLVLIMDDHGVPREIKANGVWDHWIVFNIDVDIRTIPENWEVRGKIGKNSWGDIGYGGPCPPDGKHKYVFRLYALDGVLELENGCSKESVLSTMEGHIIGKAELIGTYNKKENRS